MESDIENTNDKYYTKVEVAEQCIKVLLEHTNDCNVFIEPSAGNGSFVRSFTTHAYDLHPERSDIETLDWLDNDRSWSGSICVYGNPPFGKRNNLSKAFIKKSCEFAKVIAFVLPSVYNKYTLQKVFPADWSLVENFPLSDDSFTEFGKDYKIPSIFQVWVKDFDGVNLRVVGRNNFSNSHFSIVKEPSELFVMGAAPRTVKYPEQVLDNNRGYWIKCHIPQEIVKDNFERANWVGWSSASGGVAWLTKSEILDNYERNYETNFSQ